MNTRLLTAAFLFGLAVGQPVVSVAEQAGQGDSRQLAPPTDGPATSLGREIRRFLGERRRSSLERVWRELPPVTAFDAADPRGDWLHDWDSDWFARDWAEPTEEAPPVPSDSVAIALTCVKGQYEIEAALADEHGWRKFRASGTRKEIADWLNQLPPCLRSAIERQLAEIDSAAEGDSPPEGE